MSAPLHLDPYQLERLAEAVAAFTEISREQQVVIHGPGGEQYIEIDGTFLRIAWDEQQRHYRLDEQVGT